MAFDRHKAIEYAHNAEIVISAYLNKYGELTEEEIEEYGDFEGVVEGEVEAADDSTEEAGRDSEDERLDASTQGEESGAVREGTLSVVREDE